MSVEIKQEALGPQNSTEKQFQAVHKIEQSHDYTSTWDNREKNQKNHYLKFEKKNGPSFVKIRNRIFFIQGNSLTIFVEISPVVLEKILQCLK